MLLELITIVVGVREDPSNGSDTTTVVIYSLLASADCIHNGEPRTLTAKSERICLLLA